MQARRFINSSLVTLALAAAACGGGDDATGPSNPPAPSGNISASYGLSEVRAVGKLGGGGKGLPVTFSDASGDKLTIMGGTLVLAGDGKFDLKVQTSFNGSTTTLTDYGTYSVNASTITFNSSKSTPRLSASASVSGKKVTARSKFYGATFEIDLQRK
jgi:hypothetical protein